MSDLISQRKNIIHEDINLCNQCEKCTRGTGKKVAGNDLEKLEQLSEIVHCVERRKKK
jgi:hypothetical protein